MEDEASQRWGGIAGLAAVALGAAAVAFERPWPSADQPAALARFLADNRGAVLAQSLLFVLGAAASLCFVAALRSRLAHAEAGPATLANLALAAGAAWAAANILGQAPQISLAMPGRSADAAAVAGVVTDLSTVVLTLANLPLAVMFGATAVVTLRHNAVPRWDGWLAVVAGLAALVLSLSAGQATGPLAPQGLLSYVLVPASVVGLVPTSVLMLRSARAGDRRAAVPVP